LAAILPFSEEPIEFALYVWAWISARFETRDFCPQLNPANSLTAGQLASFPEQVIAKIHEGK
jgi:hypothetical protein